MRRKETIADVAAELGATLLSPASSEEDARRVAFFFVPEFDSASPQERVRMIERRPPSTGDNRYDALLAAIVEHLCTRWGIGVPAWVEDADRFLEPWWFVSGVRRLHASALAQSPISFARRGVFICDGALSYA